MINNNNRKILSILALLLLTFVLVGVVSATDTTTNDTTSVVKDTQANDYSNDVQVTDNAKSIQKTDKTPAIKTGVQTLTANDYTELKAHVNTAKLDENDNEYTISLVQGNQYVIDETIQWESRSASIPLNIEGNGATITGGGQHSFLTIKEGYSVNINNIIIDSTSSDNGGAINNNGTLTLTNSAITNSQATNGGAIYSTGTLNIEKVTFENNKALYRGGAILTDGKLTVSRTKFTANEVTTHQGAGSRDYGGGAICAFGELTVDESVFTANVAAHNDVEPRGDGGVAGAILVLNNSEDITIMNSNFTQNTGRHGGAITINDNLHRNEGTVIIDGNNFDNNDALYGGAIDTYHSATITNNNFTNNWIDGQGSGERTPMGGAICINNGGDPNYIVTLENNIFSGNEAKDNGCSGAIHTQASTTLNSANNVYENNKASDTGVATIMGSATFTNDTFTGNEGTDYTGVFSNFDGELSIDNCTFTDNEGNGYGDILWTNTDVTITDSTINTDDENTLVCLRGDSVITATNNTVNEVLISKGIVQTSINDIDSISITATVDTNITVVVVTNKNDTVTSGNVQVFVGNELIPTESNPTEDGFIVTLCYDTIGDEQVTIKYSDDSGVFVDSQTTTTLSVGAIPTTIDTIENVTVTIYDQTTVLVVVRDANDNIITSGNVLIVIGDEVISQNVEPTDDGFIVTIECSAIGEYVAKVNYVADDEVAMYDNSNTEFNISINPIVTSIDDIANQTVTLNHDGTVLVVVKDDNDDVVTDGDVNITIDDVNIVESIESSDDGFTVTINTDKLGDNVASVSFSDASGVYANATTTFNLTVNPMTTSIDELSPLSVVVTTNVQVLVVVRDMDGNILTTGSVKVYKSGNETELSTACVSDNEGFTVTIPGDKVGNYALDVVYVPAEDVYSSSQTQTTLDVKAFDTYIEDITPITTVANTDFTVSVKVVPSEVMTKGTVKLFIGETELDSSRYVVGDESYDITTSTDIAGDNTLTVKFISDDENYADCEITTDISVAKIDTVTTMAPLEAVVNETVTLTANVTGVNGEVINTGKVSFKVNGKTLRDTNGRILYALVVNGTASTDVTALESWTKTDSTIEAIYSGSNVTTSSKSGKVDLSVSNPPVPEEAKIEIGELDEASPGDNVTIKVTATGVSGGKVILKVNGKTVKNADGKLYAKLDENGVATFTYYVPKTAKDGNYTVKAVYTDSVYKLYDEETLIVSS